MSPSSRVDAFTRSAVYWKSISGGRWDVNFWPFLCQFFGFAVGYGLQFFCFLASGFRFLANNTSGFSNLVSDVIFCFLRTESNITEC